MEDQTNTVATETNITPTTSTTGLHQRHVTANTQTAPDFRNMWTTMSTYSAFPETNQHAIYAAMMQQAYAQYFNQYMQM